MANLLNVEDLIDGLTRECVSPEDLIVGIIRDLHYLEECSNLRYSLHLKNIIKTIIARSKVLYDHGQKMQFARGVLLHKTKLLEVRSEDQRMELSVLRSGHSEEEPSKSDGRPGNVTLIERDKEAEFSNIVRAIIDCADVVRTLESSERSLRKLSERVAGSSHSAEDADRFKLERILATTMDDPAMSGDLELDMDLNTTTGNSKDYERGRTPPPRKPQPLYNMDTTKDKSTTLLSQEELGASSDRSLQRYPAPPCRYRARG